MIYLDPLNLKVVFSPENANNLLERLDTKQLRKLGFVMMLVPTALEMRTLSFLSEIHGEASGGLRTLYVAVLGIFMLTTMLYQHKIHSVIPRDATYQGLITLYGSALMLAIWNTDIGRLPILAAPFLTATGTLLLTYQDDDMEWVPQLLRHSLRITLRDVLSSVSQKVSTDELLQLTILRWIADYWASTKDTSNDSSSSAPSPPPQPNKTKPTESSSTAIPSPATTSDIAMRPTSPSTRRSNARFKYPNHEVQWEDLLPMLSVAADHMSTEVQQLQSNSNGNTQLSNPQQNSENDAIKNLKSMLLSLNVDERAKPAVRAYRQGVEKFPPTKRVAAILSIVRRCPAVLILLWHLVLGSSSRLSSFLTLFPFVVLEYCRIKHWMESCSAMTTMTTTERRPAEGALAATFKRVLDDIDPMMILLSGDTFSLENPPTLLSVWQNITSSVSALEFGLTATRCAQTTTVAVDFAGNVISLLNFGWEVSNHGLLHGLAIMTKEIITIHVNDHLPLDQRRTVKYTNAAMDAVQNAQFFASNVKTLAQEEELDPILRPIVSTLCVLSGYGWLWGHDEETDTSTECSTTNKVVLQEIERFEELDSGSWHSLDDSKPSGTTQRSIGDRKLSLTNAVSRLCSRAKDDGFNENRGKREVTSVRIGEVQTTAIEKDSPDASESTGKSEVTSVKIEKVQTTVIEKDSQDASGKIPRSTDAITERSSSVGRQDDTTREHQDKEKEDSGGDDNWLKFGLATLGVVVGGVLLSSQGGGNANDESHNNEQNKTKTTATSMVKIVELSADDDENDWVAISN
eukprot:scaffold834_cov123-Cylindrotheca_fusiformis.AAC.21